MKYKTRALIQDIVDGICSQPGRIGLTLLAIAIGVSALTLLLALIRGLQIKSQNLIREFGADVIAIVQEKLNEENRSARLEKKHLLYLRACLPDAGVSGISSKNVRVAGTQKDVTMVRTDENLVGVRQWKMLSGRFIDKTDITHAERNAVITKALSIQQGWKPGDIIGLGRIPFRIIGIVDAGSAVNEADTSYTGVIPGERAVFVPETVHDDLPPRTPKPIPELDSIFIRPRPNSDYQRTLKRVQGLLSHPDYKVTNIYYITPETLVQNIRRLQRTLNFTLGSTAMLCLILGGVTLMSLMVANVRQRIPEIGLRRALGATGYDIAMMFIAESIVVTLTAGITSGILSHLLLVTIRNRVAVPVQIDAITILVPPAVAMVMGIIFSWWPSTIAVKISPSEALRNE
jgi:ABC-type antimicrobial peptide transport system permease subunit